MSNEIDIEKLANAHLDNVYEVFMANTYELKQFAEAYHKAKCEQSEPVATIQAPDPYDERDGVWFNLSGLQRLKKLATGTKLYTAPPQPQTVKDALEKAASICEKMQNDENNTHIGERCSYGTCQIQGSTFAKAIENKLLEINNVSI